MSKEREATIKELASRYKELRNNILPEERPLFDDAISLMERLSLVDTDRSIILDSAVGLALSSVSLNPHVAGLIPGALAALLEVLIVKDTYMEVTASGSRYRH